MVVLIGTDGMIVTQGTIAAKNCVNESFSINAVFERHTHVVVVKRRLADIHRVGKVLSA